MNVDPRKNQITWNPTRPTPNFAYLILITLFYFHLFPRYLYIYYLPSGLFVVVSWVSFLIPPEVVPGRMALLVTLFLVLINIFNTITNVSPNVEGMTAISAWMIACMFFVFGALLAYATILYFLLVCKLFIYYTYIYLSDLGPRAGSSKSELAKISEL